LTRREPFWYWQVGFRGPGSDERSASLKGRRNIIAALLTQRNIEKAAKSVGIVANTLRRWMQVPKFQKAYRDARLQRTTKPSRGFSRQLRRQPQR
jgi:transposase-like protein